jgi:abortive infection bacteriophage resistance protein
MRFTKPPLAIADQVQLLLDRGMAGDRKLMAERLAIVSYYRLTAYWHPFRQADHSFIPGTSFDVIWNRYVFDRHLRLLVMDAIERIEIAIRSQLALHHSMTYGPFAYAVNAASLPVLKSDQRKQFKIDIKQQIGKSKETFVDHFKTHYGDSHTYLPVWMATEIMSFGCMLTFYRGCDPAMKRQVAKPFGVHHTVLESWLKALNVVRNICAHHGRLWNRVFGVKPMIPNKDSQWHTPVPITGDQIMGMLTLCQYCLNHIASQSQWPARLLDLLNRFPEPPRQDMGIPDNWLSCPIWAIE